MEKCITNHQTFEIIMTKYSKINKLEEQAVKDDFNNMYLKIKEQLESNLLYQQLKEKKVFFTYLINIVKYIQFLDSFS